MSDLKEFANMNKCGLCLTLGQTNETGKLFTDGKFAAHRNCLLYSSNLCNQNSQDLDNFGGFRIQDIKNEIKRGSKLRCSLCRRKGASVGCEVKSCRRSYHYPCAIDDNAAALPNEDRGTYSIFCKLHRDMEDSSPNGQSHRTRVGSGTSNDIAEVEEKNLPDVSHPRQFQSKNSICRTRTPKKREISPETDGSDDLPIFMGTYLQTTAKSKTESKQRKLENADRTQDEEEFSNPSADNFAEREYSPSLLNEKTRQGDQVEAQLIERHWSIAETVNPENSHPQPPPISDENKPNGGNCSETSTNVDQQEVREETETEDPVQEVQMQTIEEALTRGEPSTTGRAKAFWKKCKEAQCVEKIFMKIQNDLNSIQQNIVDEKATEKDYDTAWAILLTMDRFQDFMSEFQSEIHQNLQHLEEEKISLQRRKCLVEEMKKLAGSLNRKS
ncbi:uncharacterized protein [Scyliorhinus torazame]